VRLATGEDEASLNPLLFVRFQLFQSYNMEWLSIHRESKVSASGLEPKTVHKRRHRILKIDDHTANGGITVPERR